MKHEKSRGLAALRTSSSGGVFWGLSPTLRRPFGQLWWHFLGSIPNTAQTVWAPSCTEQFTNFHLTLRTALMQWAALLHGLHTNTRAQRDQQPALGVLQVTGGPEMPVFPPIDFSEPWVSAQHSSTHLSALLTSASDPGSESLFRVMKVCLEFILLP